jgi:uncharacterized protein
MLHVNFASIVDFCLRRARVIVLASAVILVGSSAYVARHFAINSNISNLLSPNLPWRQRELAYQAAFPEQATSIIAVVGAPTPEFADASTAALVRRLLPRSNRFRSVEAAQGGEFFARNGLLYLPQDVLAERMNKLSQAAPLVRTLATDQSLRGLANAQSTGLQGVAAGRLRLDDMTRPLNTIADTVENVLAKRPATFSWQVLVNGAPAKPEDLSRLGDIVPVLDYDALEPGKTATEAVRKAVADARLDSD